MSAMRQEVARRVESRGTVLVAALYGGPYDGAEDWVFRPRTDYLRRVPRGTVRRLLGRPPRYAWYQLSSIGPDGRRADYVYRGVRASR